MQRQRGDGGWTWQGASNERLRCATTEVAFMRKLASFDQAPTQAQSGSAGGLLGLGRRGFCDQAEVARGQGGALIRPSLIAAPGRTAGEKRQLPRNPGQRTGS